MNELTRAQAQINAVNNMIGAADQSSVPEQHHSGMIEALMHGLQNVVTHLKSEPEEDTMQHPAKPILKSVRELIKEARKTFCPEQWRSDRHRDQAIAIDQIAEAVQELERVVRSGFDDGSGDVFEGTSGPFKREPYKQPGSDGTFNKNGWKVQWRTGADTRFKALYLNDHPLFQVKDGEAENVYIGTVLEIIGRNLAEVLGAHDGGG